jgi:hypothetical protein
VRSLSKLRGRLDLRPFLIGLGIATAAAFGVRALSGLSFWACFAIAAGSMVVNGWLAEWEDNQPGGFNHGVPDAGSTPEDPKSSGIRED